MQPFGRVEPEDLDWHLARLSHRVALAYLPFATGYAFLRRQQVDNLCLIW